ncbi:hypothetical protein KCU62_g88, partial [Aureobasidium sp. EXF-3399]
MKLPLPISEAYLFKLQDTPLVSFVRLFASSYSTALRRLDRSTLGMAGWEGLEAMATKVSEAKAAVVEMVWESISTMFGFVVSSSSNLSHLTASLACIFSCAGSTKRIPGAVLFFSRPRASFHSEGFSVTDAKEPFFHSTMARTRMMKTVKDVKARAQSRLEGFCTFFGFVKAFD